jgi:uncharacterized membrane protein YbhN (UPF0104 family)
LCATGKGPEKKIWYIGVSAVLSCAIFAYLLTVVRPGEIIRAIRNAVPAGIIAYMAAGLVSTVFRNIRYMELMRATDTDIPISGGEMFLVTLVRNLFSDLLPARVGSLVLVVILKARFGFPVEIGTSLWAIAFILDLVVMVPLMGVGVWVVGAAKLGISPAVLWTVASLFLIFTTALLCYLPRVMSLAGSASGRLSPGWKRAASIGEKLELTGAQIEAIYRRGIFWRVIALSFLIRALKYGCIAFLVFAVLNPIDPERYTLREIGYWPVFVGASLAEFSASTPFSGIGGFGAYEGVWTGAFYLLGYPRKLAALSGISAHIITQVFGYSLGAIAIIILMTPLLKRGRR